MPIGKLCLALALPVSVFSFIASLLGQKNPGMLLKARKMCHVVTGLVSVASLMLVYAFVSDTFQLEYVYSYSSKSLPLIYKLTGLWAGLDGSLLFWLWILVVCASIVSFTKKSDEFYDINVILQAIIIFFVLMLVFVADPFKTLLETPLDGKDLNPLLQNPFMIIHPPALYLGYVGFSVPFAYALTMLLRNNPSFTRLWFDEIRLWVIVSWLFLTVGNILGAMWAYVELGWGGFWAWDPVENAGILPWFTATAFLHSLVIQERKGVFKTMNLALLILTFLLTIFGTFITRSGVIKSVHSFSDVTIGLCFIVFLAIATIFSTTLSIARHKKLHADKSVKSLLSREGVFYFSVLLLIFSMFVILWGTILPLVRELIYGDKIEVGPKYFNKHMAPLGIVLLFLMGIGPVMNWGKAKKDTLRKNFLIPLIISSLVGISIFAFGVRAWFSLAVAFGATFVGAIIFDEFANSLRVVVKRIGCGKAKGLIDLFRISPRRYGGYIVHLGVVLLFIGFAGSVYQKEFSFKLSKGEVKKIEGYEFSLAQLQWAASEQHQSVVSTVDLSKGGELIEQLRPALILHKNQQKPNAEVDFHMNIFKDIYLALEGVSEDGKDVSFLLTVNPLIEFVWLGGIVMVIGATAAILLKKRRRKRESDISGDLEIDIALGRESVEASK